MNNEIDIVQRKRGESEDSLIIVQTQLGSSVEDLYSMNIIQTIIKSWSIIWSILLTTTLSVQCTMYTVHVQCTVCTTHYSIYHQSIYVTLSNTVYLKDLKFNIFSHYLMYKITVVQISTTMNHRPMNHRPTMQSSHTLFEQCLF